MNHIKMISLFLFLFVATTVVAAKNTITFKSGDGVNITADVYISHDSTAPFIVLFHQAGWSRGEYLEIAPKLNKLGFNCMAVDLRSGSDINEVMNMTHKSALKMNKSTDYLDALPDIDAAVKYAKTNFAAGKLIIWGSSYSAALVIKYAGDNPGSVDGVLSFSPGEYFVKEGKSKTFISNAAKNIEVPVFITSAHNEKSNWIQIYNSLPGKDKKYFIPKTKGHHGSRSLWSKFNDSGDYWAAVKSFLKKHFNTKTNLKN